MNHVYLLHRKDILNVFQTLLKYFVIKIMKIQSKVYLKFHDLIIMWINSYQMNNPEKSIQQ